MSALCQKRTSEPVYSITSSARPSRESGVLRPRAFADLRLIIISSFVAWTTGRSAGFTVARPPRHGERQLAVLTGLHVIFLSVGCSACLLLAAINGSAHPIS